MALLLTALVSSVRAALFSLSSIASLGSGLALLVFSLVTVGHLRVSGRQAPAPGSLFWGCRPPILLTSSDLFSRLLQTKPLTGPQWLLALLATVALLAAWEIGKRIARRRGRAR